MIARRALVFGALCLLSAAALPADGQWIEGKNYFRVQPPVPVNVPAGKVEVTEVFSYGCPACNRFAPFMRSLKQGLPANAVVNYVPASWNTAEAWPMFQRAYLTAANLGVADRAHDAVYDSIWKNGELAITDSSGRVKGKLPTIEDAARFYAKTTGVDAAKFVATAKSFAVEVDIKRAEDRIVATKADQTPTIIVNGKYRTNPSAAGSDAKLVELVKWLVARESGAK
jgi:thiol:disulfide interchange protein DsbA